ncbi:hypothetical protein OIU78_021180 [Salix suchowensis]|nr:hypothetical protein OIU78_021180 [Salix suchowensis]
MASASLALLVLAFFVFSALVDAQVTVYCQPSDYADEALMQWMYDNGISCEPSTGTTTPSTSSKMTEVDCGGTIFYVDESALQWIYDNNIPCKPIRKKKSNKLPIILGHRDSNCLPFLGYCGIRILSQEKNSSHGCNNYRTS